MLKRMQILLDDWQVEHYKLMSQKYDVSFSEMIRMALCLDIMAATRISFPKYKWEIDERTLKNVLKKRNIVRDLGDEQFHTFLSKIYFQARKATEFWSKTAKK